MFVVHFVGLISYLSRDVRFRLIEDNRFNTSAGRFCRQLIVCCVLQIKHSQWD